MAAISSVEQSEMLEAIPPPTACLSVSVATAKGASTL